MTVYGHQHVGAPRKNNNFAGFGDMFCYHFVAIGVIQSDMKPVKHDPLDANI